MTTITLRVREPHGTKCLTVDGDLTLENLERLIKEQTGLSALRILQGFPPRPLAADLKQRIGDALQSGDLLTVEAVRSVEGPAAFEPPLVARSPSDGGFEAGASTLPAQAAVSPTCSAGAEEPRTKAPLLERVVVPDDNSCLFRSVAFVLRQYLGGIELQTDELRELVAEAIGNDPWTYNDAVLGRTNAEYQEWIKRPTSWGGAIELEIFANHFGIQIASFDVRTTRMDVFGESAAYPCRAYLCYDGIHYDPLALRSYEQEPEDSLLTVFSSDDTQVEMLARTLIQNLHASRSYTDTANFLVTCRECGAELRGEDGALEHARATGHSGFVEQ
ncbi:hypothetical protein F1559_002180 [Cyanidiococcus yangmingshanensis]|uniref:Ubiquitin thioesterase OTU n=1 Tax=Cyanidiococcus yangmingshanensis TaxID=2690220 RepID=A0A7J7IIZ3_9RHOD|nr:hypothetical protein F1559_002180 [Cyanidiococcus yangmingshanensis]